MSTMKKHAIYGLLVSLWIGISILFASHLSLKGSSGDSGPNSFTHSGYNFEYKYGFPTPWYSRYYQIPADQLDEYQGAGYNVATPPHSYLIYIDVSKPVLIGQFLIAAIPSLILLLTLRALGYVSRPSHTKSS